MGLRCNRMEHCNWCPPRSPRKQCWWIIGETGPWRLCASCYEHETGEAPDRQAVPS